MPAVVWWSSACFPVCPGTHGNSSSSRAAKTSRSADGSPPVIVLWWRCLLWIRATSSATWENFFVTQRATKHTAARSHTAREVVSTRRESKRCASDGEWRRFDRTRPWNVGLYPRFTAAGCLAATGRNTDGDEAGQSEKISAHAVQTPGRSFTSECTRRFAVGTSMVRSSPSGLVQPRFPSTFAGRPRIKRRPVDIRFTPSARRTSVEEHVTLFPPLRHHRYR